MEVDQVRGSGFIAMSYELWGLPARESSVIVNAAHGQGCLCFFSCVTWLVMRVPLTREAAVNRQGLRTQEPKPLAETLIAISSLLAAPPPDPVLAPLRIVLEPGTGTPAE